jgi:hypothetical protein
MRRFLVALVLAAIAISPAASQSSDSGRSFARCEPRTHHSARSEARNRPTGHSRFSAGYDLDPGSSSAADHALRHLVHELGMITMRSPGCIVALGWF